MEFWSKVAHRKSDIQTVIYNDFALISPDVVEEIHHNLGGLVPYQFVVPLEMAFRFRR
jgi:hypothetical protein